MKWRFKHGDALAVPLVSKVGQPLFVKNLGIAWIDFKGFCKIINASLEVAHVIVAFWTVLKEFNVIRFLLDSLLIEIDCLLVFSLRVEAAAKAVINGCSWLYITTACKVADCLFNLSVLELRLRHMEHGSCAVCLNLDGFSKIFNSQIMLTEVLIDQASLYPDSLVVA